MKKMTVALLLLALVCSVHAQDTLKMMTYNVLNYPQAGDTRDVDFRVIMEEVQPDILIAQEVASLAGADMLLNNALNVGGVNSYNRAPLMNDNGGWFGNMLYYNSTKLVLKAQTDIYVYPRDITHYELYYNDPQLACHEDTMFLNVFSCHLKASQGATNAEARADAVDVLYAYMDGLPNLENVLVGGDFNFYSDNSTGEEPGYHALIDPGNSQVLQDVVPGWLRKNYAYRDVFTQSTRSDDYPGSWGGSPGGIDDRFDMIFFADEIMSGTGEVSLLSGSYEVYGNDGLHYDKALIDPSVSVPGGGLNAEVSDAVANALFEMSDHFPVLAELVIDPVGSCDLRLEVRALMEAVYDGAGGMQAELNELSLLPGTQVFSGAPWNYAGTESYPVSAGDPLVDWVLIELYAEADTSLVAQQAAMLLEDGSVVNANATHTIEFESLPGANYFVALRSRNHLPVISRLPQPLGGGLLMYDFTLADQTMGSIAKQAGADFVIPAGDFTANGVIEFGDYGLYMVNPSAIYTYLNADVDMDGLVTVADYNWYKLNWTLMSVPKVRY